MSALTVDLKPETPKRKRDALEMDTTYYCTIDDNICITLTNPGFSLIT
jgi:hypothetical protein